MDWKQRYAGKLTTAEDAIRSLAPGRRFFIGSGAAEPRTLTAALITYGDHFADNEIVHLLTLGDAPYVQPGMEKRFRHTAFFIGKNVREAVQAGRADFMPVFLSEIPKLIRTRRVGVDVAMVQVSPPDAHGLVSLGVSVDIVRAAVESADILIAEVNPHMPRTLGDSFVHVDQIDKLVPVDYKLPELATDPLDDVCREIGQHVASLIPNRATLQTGIGRIPHAVLQALGDHAELGVHTEMMSDSVIDLVEGGVITGSAKTLLPGKLVTSFIMGTQRLYDWVDDNPLVEMRASNFTNDPFTIARNDHMIAINSALAIDLTGQVASDTLGGRFFSGIGGQVDFIRGAARSHAGKAIIALPSTAKGGKLSRILAAFEEGAGVVTSRGDVHYVVTEFGVAHLWGKNIRQRAMALVDIAHPDFRSDLLDAGKKRHFVFLDEVAPVSVYRWEGQRNTTLADGQRVMVRPLRISDDETLQDLFYRLSDENVYSRFLSHKRTHSHEEMQRLVSLDYDENMALVISPSENIDDILAMARYDVDPATGLADIAFVVHQDWMRRGLGTLLMKRMTEIAKRRGVPGFTADVLAANTAMLAIFRKSGLELQSEQADGVFHLTMTIPQSVSKPPSLRPRVSTAPAPFSVQNVYEKQEVAGVPCAQTTRSPKLKR